MKSSYCPNELFSMKQSKIESALRKLLHTPQNNLALWISDGETKVVGTSDLEKRLPFHIDDFISACAKALEQSNVLDDILRVQALAGTLTAHDLLEGTYQRTESELPEEFIVAKVCQCNQLAEKDTCDQELAWVVPCHSPVEPVERFYAATTVKDCSIMVTIEKATERNAKGAFEADDGVHVTSMVGDVPFLCRVAVVDLDEKKSKSLQHYRKHELSITEAHRASAERSIAVLPPSLREGKLGIDSSTKIARYISDV